MAGAIMFLKLICPGVPPATQEAEGGGGRRRGEEWARQAEG